MHGYVRPHSSAPRSAIRHCCGRGGMCSFYSWYASHASHARLNFWAHFEDAYLIIYVGYETISEYLLLYVFACAVDPSYFCLSSLLCFCRCSHATHFEDKYAYVPSAQDKLGSVNMHFIFGSGKSWNCELLSSIALRPSRSSNHSDLIETTQLW